MSLDKITQFELGIVELNRNVAYKEKDKISDNYNQLNVLYHEILKLDIPIKQKNAMYSSVLEVHQNIKEMDISRGLGTPKIVGLSVAALLAGFFLFNGSNVTGMVISDGGTIINSITRFAPTGVLVASLIFMIIKEKKKQ